MSDLSFDLLLEEPPIIELTLGDTLAVSIDALGLQGPPGPSGTVAPELAEALEPLLKGQPLYVASDGRVGLASATAINLSRVCGVALSDTNATFSAPYKFADVIERNDWSAIAGTSSLSPGALYFLSTTPGQISLLPPNVGYVVPVGQALTTTKLSLRLQSLIQL